MFCSDFAVYNLYTRASPFSKSGSCHTNKYMKTVVIKEVPDYATPELQTSLHNNKGGCKCPMFVRVLNQRSEKLIQNTPWRLTGSYSTPLVWEVIPKSKNGIKLLFMEFYVDREVEVIKRLRWSFPLFSNSICSPSHFH